MKNFEKFVKSCNFSFDKGVKIVYNSHELAMANKIKGTVMDLREAEIGKEYIVKDVQTDDDELNAFLFSLGCYSGEPITVIARRKSGLTVAIKDARYNIDNLLAQTILI